MIPRRGPALAAGTRAGSRRSAPLSLRAALLLVAAAALLAGTAPAGSRAAAPAIGPGDVLTTAQVARQGMQAVVGILSTIPVQTRSGSSQDAVGSGTGFVIDRQGHILTSQHVIDGASKLHVSFFDGTKVDATVVAADALLDLAVLKVSVPPATLRPLVLGGAEQLQVGDPVLAVGNPFGYERSVSTGIVSALHRQMTAPNGFTISNSIQTDTAVNHGNSGGPLLDAAGHVVGVNAQIADSGVNANVGVAFAVALDAPARAVVAQLVAGRPVAHPWLGVSLDDIDAILATSGAVKATTGALVTGIVAGGPAQAAGLRGGSQAAAIDGASYCLGGDIVTSVAGRPVLDAAALQIAISALRPGSTVRLGVVRAGGARATIVLRLGTQPTSADAATTTGCG